jgi:hypothetical protein
MTCATTTCAPIAVRTSQWIQINRQLRAVLCGGILLPGPIILIDPFDRASSAASLTTTAFLSASSFASAAAELPEVGTFS